MPREDATRPRMGTTKRSDLRRQQPPTDRRLGLVLIAGAAVIGIGALAWLFGAGASPASSPTPTPTDVAIATRGPSPSPVEPILTPDLEPTASVTASPEPSTPEPSTPEPSIPAPSIPAPSPSILGLNIDFPADGETVVSRAINVIGTGPPGATVTRDIPLWFDDHTTVREDGLWMLRVELTEGDNRLTFRIGDDRSTEQRISVAYRPDG